VVGQTPGADSSVPGTEAVIAVVDVGTSCGAVKAVDALVLAGWLVVTLAISPGYFRGQ